MIDVVVLAAGAATRFGSDKLVASVDGRSLLDVTIAAVLDVTTTARTLVVVGPDHDERAAIAMARGARVVIAHDARRGQRWSIDAGLAAVDPSAAGATLVLGDDPLAIAALPEVLAHAIEHPLVACAVRRNGAPHPVFMPRGDWPTPTTEDDDRGLRRLLGERTRWLDAPHAPSCDVDVPTDLPTLARLLDA